MSHSFSVGEFYMLLKLGIWRSGRVDFWGQSDVTPLADNVFFPNNSHSRYVTNPLIRKHLYPGIYLLDLFYMGRDVKRGMNTYRLIVAVCRNDLAHLEAVYQVQVSNPLPMKEFYVILNEGGKVLGNSGQRKADLPNHPVDKHTRNHYG